MNYALKIFTLLTALIGLIGALIKVIPDSKEPNHNAVKPPTNSVNITGTGNNVSVGNTTTNIIQSPQPPKPALDMYHNARFDFEIEYPSSWARSGEPTNGDGVFLETGDPRLRISTSGSFNMDLDVFDYCKPTTGDSNSLVLNNRKQAGFIKKRHDGLEQWTVCYCSDLVCAKVYAEGPAAALSGEGKTILAVMKSLSIGSCTNCAAR